eukprot:3936097-Rhodomonas_salina.1
MWVDVCVAGAVGRVCVLMCVRVQQRASMPRCASAWVTLCVSGRAQERGGMGGQGESSSSASQPACGAEGEEGGEVRRRGRGRRRRVRGGRGGRRRVRGGRGRRRRVRGG